MVQEQPDMSAQEAQAGRLPNKMPQPEGKADVIVITDLSDCGKLNLRCKPAASSLLVKYLGSPLPEVPNTVSKNGDRRILWLGPDEFLVLMKAGEEDNLSIIIGGALAKQHHAATIVTDALSCLQLDGSAVRDLLAKGCSIDLHPTKFTEGMCAQTLLTTVGVTIFCDGKTSLRIICRTSFLDYLIAWLKDAALEYGYRLNR